MADKAVIHDIKFMTCKYGHLHMIMVDKDGNELTDAVFVNPIEAAAFCEAFSVNAALAFNLEGSIRGKEDTLQ